MYEKLLKPRQSFRITLYLSDKIIIHYFQKLSRYSDSLLAGRSGDRIPQGARLSAPVQTGPGAHPASYTMVTGSYVRVKRPQCGLDHPLTFSAEVKGRVELYLYSTSGPLPLPLPLLMIQNSVNFTAVLMQFGPWTK